MNYEEILTELIETCFAGTNSNQSKAIGAQIADILVEILVTYWRHVLRQQQWKNRFRIAGSLTQSSLRIYELRLINLDSAFLGTLTSIDAELSTKY
jgi:hypothetical protein